MKANKPSHRRQGLFTAIEQKAPFRMKSKVYSWAVFVLCAAFIIYKYLLQVSPSVMTGELMHEFQVTGLGLAHLSAAFFYSFFVAQCFVGYCLDKYNLRILTAMALVLCGLGAYTFGSARTFEIALLSRAVIGTGAAFATVNYLKLTSVWFPPHQFSFISGLLPTAVMIGAVLGQVLLLDLIAQQGWRTVMIGCGVLGLGLAIIFFLLIRSPSIDSTSASFFSKKTVWEVLSTPQNWILTLYSGLAFAPMDAFAGLWGVPFLCEAYALSAAQSATLTSCMFIGLGVGSPLLGWLASVTGKTHLIMSISAASAFIMMSVIIAAPSMPISLIGILLFSFGFSTSAFMLGFALGKDLNPLTATATIVALINTGDVFVSAITEPLIGFLLDWGWEGALIGNIRHFSLSLYQKALLVLPIYLFFAWILLFCMRKEALPKRT